MGLNYAILLQVTVTQQCQLVQFWLWVMGVVISILVHCSLELSVSTVLKAYLNFLPLAGIYPQVVPVNKGDHALGHVNLKILKV